MHEIEVRANGGGRLGDESNMTIWLLISRCKVKPSRDWFGCGRLGDEAN